jgi:predicted nicotinamide N-methyase
MKKSRELLLKKIGQRGFETVTEELSFGPVKFAFVRVKDPDAVLDRVANEGGTVLPYWSELWESAAGIAQYLVDRYTRRDAPAMETLSVLDLGCGQGLGGTVAARMGANVLLADIDEDALLFAELNSMSPGDRVRVKKLDWQKDTLREKFDLIIGADVVYERSQWEFLDRFWKGHLADNGVVLLGEPGRQTGEEFMPWARGRGWGIEMHNVEARGRRIMLMEMRR